MFYIILDHSIKAILITPNKQLLKSVYGGGGGILCLPFQNKEKLKQKTPQFHVWLKLAEWFWKIYENVKITDRRTDDGDQASRKAHLSFQLNKNYVCNKEKRSHN